MELIRLENIHKTYHLGEVDVPVLKGVSLSIRRGDGRPDGRFRLGQDDADEHPGLSRPAHLGRILARRPGGGAIFRPTSGHWCGRRSSASSFKASTCCPRTTRHQQRSDAARLCPAVAFPAKIARSRSPRLLGARRLGRPARPCSLADVRRPATAGGDRAGFDQPAGPAVGRRTDRQSRFAHERRDSARCSSNSTPRGLPSCW